nr:helix-turn-helix domain-containing protein [Microbacterium lemovicicum]
MSDDVPEASRRRGSYAKGLARRQQILDRAIEVFAERGAERTSLRSIADAIGVSHAALTHYFTSREQLLVEVYRASERRADETEPHPQDTSAVGVMMESARRNRTVPGLVQLYSTLVATALEEGHPDAREFATQRFSRIRTGLADDIRAQQRAGRLRADVDAELAASLVIAASDGLQTQWLLDDAVDLEGALGLLDGLLSPRENP